MRRTDAAEILLSLATTPGRAANIAGDLSEEAAGRSTVWFWVSLMRISSSFIWKGWNEKPLRMLGLGFGAFVLNTAIVLTLFTGLAVATTMQGPFASLAPVWMVIISQAATGRWLARRSSERVLSACVAFFVIDTVILTSFTIASLLASPSSFEVIDDGIELFMNAAGYPFVFIGIGQVQARAQ